jgi:hypothetical protein
MFNKKTPIKKRSIYIICTNLILINSNHIIVRFGNINNDSPIHNENHPIKVMMSFQLSSQILWNNIFNRPMIMDIKEDMIRNFSSFKSLNICLVRFGLKLNIKKKIMRYHPQNFAKKIETSIIYSFYS